MNKRLFTALFALVTFVVGVAIARIKLAEWRAAPTPPSFHESAGYRLSGPYVHENLTMFMIHAPDLILPAQSERIGIASFCVEQSRWRQRGTESADHFAMTDSMISTKGLKTATRQSSQGQVWNQVSEAQGKLSQSLNSDVRSNVSESSLQLTLEDAELKKSASEYMLDSPKLPR